MLVRSRLPGLSGTGVLADRALLVVTEYLEHGELPPDGRQILTRFRNRFDEAQRQAGRPGLHSIGTASLDVRSASEQALRSLAPQGSEGADGSPTIDEILDTLDRLGGTGRAEKAEVQTLRSFLERYSENTLLQSVPRLGEHSLFHR
jgi:hypothetical protein